MRAAAVPVSQKSRIAPHASGMAWARRAAQSAAGTGNDGGARPPPPMRATRHVAPRAPVPAAYASPALTAENTDAPVGLHCPSNQTAQKVLAPNTSAN